MVKTCLKRSTYEKRRMKCQILKQIFRFLSIGFGIEFNSILESNQIKYLGSYQVCHNRPLHGGLPSLCHDLSLLLQSLDDRL